METLKKYDDNCPKYQKYCINIQNVHDDDKCPVKHDALKATYRTVRVTHGQFQIHLGSYLLTPYDYYFRMRTL